jgi:hypothetical protein
MNLSRDYETFIDYMQWIADQYNAMLTIKHSPVAFNCDGWYICVESSVINYAVGDIEKYNKQVAQQFLLNWTLTSDEFILNSDFRVKAYFKQKSKVLYDKILENAKSKMTFVKESQPAVRFDPLTRRWYLYTYKVSNLPNGESRLSARGKISAESLEDLLERVEARYYIV